MATDLGLPLEKKEGKEAHEEARSCLGGTAAAVELGKKALHEERAGTKLGKALAEHRTELQQQQQAMAQTRQPPRREVTKEPEIQYEMPNGRPLCPEFQHGKCATQATTASEGFTSAAASYGVAACAA